MEAPSVEYGCDEHGRLSPRTEQHRGGPHLCSMDEGNARGSARRCTRMLDLSTWQKERRGSGRNQCLTDCRYFFLFFLRSCWGLLGGWTSRVCKVELAAAPATHRLHPFTALFNPRHIEHSFIFHIRTLWDSTIRARCHFVGDFSM